MSTARLRSLNDSSDQTDDDKAVTPIEDAARPETHDDAIPESWRSLADATPAPGRIVPHTAAVRAASVPEPRAPRRIGVNVLLAVLAGAVVVEGAILAQLIATPAPAALPVTTPVPVTIGSANPGDSVFIDGRQVGVTPYVVNIEPAMHEIRVVGASRAPVEPVSPPQPVKPESTEMSAAAPRTGGMKLSSPIEVQVLEGDRVLGSSVDGPVVTTAGVHQFDLLNSELGYRERRRIEIKAGQITTIALTPPNGRLNINAVPWAQVSIDGRDAGETPLANLALPIGAHNLVFQHPQFGERAERVIVKAGALTRVSVTMGR